MVEETEYEQRRLTVVQREPLWESMAPFHELLQSIENDAANDPPWLKKRRGRPSALIEDLKRPDWFIVRGWSAKFRKKVSEEWLIREERYGPGLRRIRAYHAKRWVLVVGGALGIVVGLALSMIAISGPRSEAAREKRVFGVTAVVCGVWLVVVGKLYLQPEHWLTSAEANELADHHNRGLREHPGELAPASLDTGLLG